VGHKEHFAEKSIVKRIKKKSMRKKPKKESAKNVAVWRFTVISVHINERKSVWLRK